MNSGVFPSVFVLLLIHIPGLSPSHFLPNICLYALLLSLNQWMILRQSIKPAWSWIIVSPIAITISIFSGGAIGVVCNFWFKLSYGLSALMGGLGSGLIYGLITVAGLRHITGQKHLAPKRQNTPLSIGKTKCDSQTKNQSLGKKLIANCSLILILVVWWQVLPPLSSSGIPVNPFLLFGFLLLYGYLSIFIHELGHFLFAWINGAELHHFAIDRFIFTRRGHALKLYRCRQRLAAGFVSVIPRSLHRLDQQIFLMILGGPVASFLLFFVGAIPFLFPALLSQYHIIWWFTFASVMNLYHAVFNTIPLKVGYMSTDGRRLLDLAQKNPQGQRFSALHRFIVGIRKGVRPRDMDPDIIDPLLALPETSMDHISGLLIAYYLKLDTGELKQAGIYLDQALDMIDHYPPLFRGSLLLEGAYFEAHIRHRPNIARQWFEQIQEQALIPPYALLRAEASLLLAEGNQETARTKAQRGLECAQHNPFMVGFAMADQERLQGLLQAMT